MSDKTQVMVEEKEPKHVSNKFINAINKSELFIARDLLINGFVSKYDQKQIFERCISKQNIDGIELLIKHGQIIPSDDHIEEACQNGKADVVRVLLADGRANPAAEKNYAFSEAVEKNYIEIVAMLLLDKRADPRVGFYTACKKGHIEIVRLLLNDSRVDATVGDNQAIKIASRNGHLLVVSLLTLVRGTDLHAALKSAIDANQNEIVTLLTQILDRSQ
jgi:ankyrin repeat protein